MHTIFKYYISHTIYAIHEPTCSQKASLSACCQLQLFPREGQHSPSVPQGFDHYWPPRFGHHWPSWWGWVGGRRSRRNPGRLLLEDPWGDCCHRPTLWSDNRGNCRWSVLPHRITDINGMLSFFCHSPGNIMTFSGILTRLHLRILRLENLYRKVRTFATKHSLQTFLFA